MQIRIYLQNKANNDITIKKTYKNSCVLLDTNSNDVISITKSLVSKKSAGFDGIFTVILKYTIEAITLPLINIIDKSLPNGIVPTALKIA